MDNNNIYSNTIHLKPLLIKLFYLIDFYGNLIMPLIGVDCLNC